jgi:hypothetical protein
VTPEAAAKVPPAPAHEEPTGDWLATGEDAASGNPETPILLGKLTAHLRGLGRD